MTTAPVEVQTLSRSRAAIYGFIAWLLLNQPDADLVTRLQANDIQDSLTILPYGSKSTSTMIDGLKQMRSSLLESSPQTSADLCLALAVEHTRYLRGVGRSYCPPPPYESLYRSSEDGEENTFLLQLTEFYQQAQAACRTENAERVDYLGIELDFMRLLCEEESRAADGVDPVLAAHFVQLQQHFLRKHLLAWAPRFCKEFLNQTTTGFYLGVVQLLLGFLEAEASVAGADPIEGQNPSDSSGKVLGL
jgi:TorA maturation chaperone TorD